MPHITLDGNRYNISAKDAENVRGHLLDAVESGEHCALEFTDTDGSGDTSWFLWTPGVPVVINSWEVHVL